MLTDGAWQYGGMQFTILVNDIQLPVIIVRLILQQATIFVYVDAVVNYATACGLDNCTGSVTVQITGLASSSTFPTELLPIPSE